MPADGIFLEWAPIWRCYRHAINDPNCAVNAKRLTGLKNLLQIFEPRDAQILEYWINARLFCRRHGEKVKLPFIPEVMEADVTEYAALGVGSITSFGCGVDADYLTMFGAAPIGEYGAILER